MKLRKLLAIALTSAFFFSTNADMAYAATVYQWGTVSSLQSLGVFKTAISSNGTVVLVGTQGSGVYLSTNSGSTFTKISSIPNAVYGVAMSANGSKMFAAARDSSAVYASTDAGVTWTSTAGTVGSYNNYATCMSGNGSVWMVGTYSGSVYTSTNNGSSWTTNGTLGVLNWWSCYISYDGSKRLALPWATALRYSSDSGATWATSSTTVNDAYCLGASDDGTKVIIGSRGSNYLYRSTNSGATFTQSLSAATTGNTNVYGCSSSGDGTKLIAVTTGGKVLVSIDSGSNWTLESGIASGDWYNVSMSYDGSRAIVGPSTSSYTSVLGYVLAPATFTLLSSPVTSLIRRTGTVLSVQSNYPGKVTFYANGKRVAGCISVPTATLIASCTYKPAVTKAVKLTAKIVFTDSSLGQKDLDISTALVVPRTSNR